jgi:hypothetical protein
VLFSLPFSKHQILCFYGRRSVLSFVSFPDKETHLLPDLEVESIHAWSRDICTSIGICGKTKPILDRFLPRTLGIIPTGDSVSTCHRHIKHEGEIHMSSGSSLQPISERSP